MTIAIQFDRVSCHFGPVRAVDGVSFEIRDGEFFALLGPSGSGKTTSLRLIAGFEQPTAGSIRLHGREMGGVPPYERDINTVFQDYALFPHMTVAENVAYGLMIRKVPAAERRRRAEEMLETVRLPGMGDRKPSQLSGGQRQRVALARALINRPSVLLLDEPLGALDLKLREQMQTELKALQRQVGITFIYVTHDQGEALSMADRLAVFNQGRIEQIGTPADVYDRPATTFVAGFVGVSNLLRGAVAQRLTGRSAPVSIRPEKIRLAEAGTEPPAGWYCLSGRIESVLFLGAVTRYNVGLDEGGELAVIEQNLEARSEPLVRNQPVRLMWPAAELRILAESDGLAAREAAA